LDIEDVEEIEIETGPVAFTSAGIREPKIGVEGKFSLWFLAALALTEGNVTLDKFTDEKVNDPRLVNLRRKVNATLVRELGLGARVIVRMKDGIQYKGFKATPKGSPEDPLSLEEIKTKFRDASKPAIPEKNIELLLDKIGILEKLTGIEEIITLTKPGPK